MTERASFEAWWLTHNLPLHMRIAYSATDVERAERDAAWEAWQARALLAGGDQKAAPLHPSSVQAVDGDEPKGGA